MHLSYLAVQDNSYSIMDFYLVVQDNSYSVMHCSNLVVQDN